jgi:hypothetical protein
MGVYDRAVATAKRLVEKYGATVTLTKPSATVEDANKPWRGPASGAAETTETPKGVGLDYDDREVGEMFTDVGGSTDQVKRGDVKLLVAADSLSSQELDLKGYTTATVGGRTYSVRAAKRLRPGDVTILWELLLRQ